MIASFGQGKRPPPTDLVLWDGLDQFEKEYAVAFYGNKTWQDVFTHLQGLKHAVAGAEYRLEEWSVLNPEYLTYYLRAHLEYLFETITLEMPDTEFVLQLFRELQQVIRIHSGKPFTLAQIALLKRVAQYVDEQASKRHLFANQEKDIEEYATELFVGLEACGR